MSTDEELMAAYIRDDQSAFRQLFERLAPQLLRMLRRYASNEADARDLVQQAFLQMHRARREFQKGALLRPWLFTIAFNLGRDHARRQGRRRFDALHQEPTAEASSPATQVQKRQEAAEIHRAIDDLPVEQRDAVVLHWFDGLSFPEIAAATGSSLSAVKVRAHRGYQKLKERLAAVTGEGVGT